MATGPWSVKGIDPRAREAAKLAAQREGITLGEWMNRRLLGDGQSPAHASVQARASSQERALFTAPGAFSILGRGDNDRGDLHDTIEELAARLEAAERRSTLAITGIDQSVLGMLTRLEGMEKNQDEITDKLKESLANLGNTVSSSRHEIERNVDKVDRAMEETAKRIDTVGRHTEVELSGVRHELSKELELVNSRSDELSQRMGAAERMTDNAVRTLEASFASIDDRLRRTEQTNSENGVEGLSDMFRRRFKVLSEELITVVAQTRGQLAAQIESQSAGPKLAQFQKSLGDMRGQFAKTERRHADSLERIASEVGKLGGAITQRLGQSEQETERKIDHALDTRLREFQNDHAAAIDKIGDGLTGAIARLEEKINATEAQREIEDSLEARMASSEERTARMIEDVMERIEHRIASTAVDEESPVQRALTALAVRLEALEGTTDDSPPFDADPYESGSFNPALEAHGISQAPKQAASAPEAEEGYNPVLEEILRPPSYGANEMPPSLPPLPPEPIEERQSEDRSMAQPPVQAAAPAFENLEDHGASADLPPEAPHDIVLEQNNAAAPDHAPHSRGFEQGPEHNADHNHDQTYGQSDPQAQWQATPSFERPPSTAPVGATADASFMAAARASVRAPGPHAAHGNLGHIAPGRPDGASGVSRKLLVTASVIALIAVLAAGSLTVLNFGKSGDGDGIPAVSSANADWDALINGTQNANGVADEVDLPASEDGTALNGVESASLAGGQNTSINPAYAGKPDPASTTQASPVQAQRPAPKRQVAAIETTPQPQPSIPVVSAPLPSPVTAQADTPQPVQASINTRPGSGRQTIQQAAQSGDPIAQFQLASAMLDAGDEAGGIVLLRQAANRGLPIAQYRLGKLHEEGSATIAKDEAEGRRWTERAANGGNRRAMHNLAMMYAEGQGVEQGYENAAKWFQEAALMGLTNSQYNLAFLYEQGLGVPESLTDAYAWYSIAAKAGDAGAQERIEEIGPTLLAEAKGEAQKLITQFRPRPLDLAANGIFRNVNWARPQLNTAPSIARAQVLLARLGYQPGAADGNPGNATKSAVIAYERDNGLAQTGRIDANLLAKLEAAAIN